MSARPDAEAEFDKLPIEVKNKWDNNVEKYIMSYGTEEWANKMGILPKTSDAAQHLDTAVSTKNEEVSK